MRYFLLKPLAEPPLLPSSFFWNRTRRRFAAKVSAKPVAKSPFRSGVYPSASPFVNTNQTFINDQHDTVGEFELPPESGAPASAASTPAASPFSAMPSSSPSPFTQQAMSASPFTGAAASPTGSAASSSVASPFANIAGLQGLGSLVDAKNPFIAPPDLVTASNPFASKDQKASQAALAAAGATQQMSLGGVGGNSITGSAPTPGGATLTSALSSSSATRTRLIRAHDRMTLVGQQDIYSPSASTQYAGYDPLPNTEDRRWNKIDNWCTLCKEPFGQWNEHRGKRDHICLEMFFDAILDVHRLYQPMTAWQAVDIFKEITVQKMYRDYERNQVERRREIFTLVRYLQDIGVVFLSPKRHNFGLVSRSQFMNAGMNFMFKFPHQTILNVCPRADAKQISALTQMCQNGYNMETVFDLCGFKDLLGEEDLPTMRMGEKVTPETMPHQLKTKICIHLLGQLRWAMESHCHPRPQKSVFAQTCPDHITQIVEHVGYMLATEFIYTRISEYVCRVEPVWRAAGATPNDRIDSRKVHQAAPLPFEHTGHHHFKDYHFAMRQMENDTRRKKSRQTLEQRHGGGGTDATAATASKDPPAMRLLKEKDGAAAAATVNTTSTSNNGKDAASFFSGLSQSQQQDPQYNSSSSGSSVSASGGGVGGVALPGVSPNIEWSPTALQFLKEGGHVKRSHGELVFSGAQSVSRRFQAQHADRIQDFQAHFSQVAQTKKKKQEQQLRLAAAAATSESSSSSSSSGASSSTTITHARPKLNKRQLFQVMRHTARKRRREQRERWQPLLQQH